MKLVEGGRRELERLAFPSYGGGVRGFIGSYIHLHSHEAFSNRAFGAPSIRISGQHSAPAVACPGTGTELDLHHIEQRKWICSPLSLLPTRCLPTYHQIAICIRIKKWPQIPNLKSSTSNPQSLSPSQSSPFYFDETAHANRLRFQYISLIISLSLSVLNHSKWLEIVLILGRFEPP